MRRARQELALVKAKTVREPRIQIFGSRLRIVLGGSMFDNASPRSNYERRVPSV